MLIELDSLAKRAGISTPELILKLNDLGFQYDEENGVSEDIAELVLEELQPASIADVYDEMIAMEREREIVKSQRKQSIGKDKKVQDKKSEDSTVKVTKLVIGDSISVKEFAEKTGIGPAKIIGELMKNKILANINQQIDYATLEILASEFGITLEKKQSDVNISDVMSGNLENLLKESDPSKLQVRPPVVTIMGHVDHGKTKLLDYIRNTHVMEGESGGITQHIGAYQVEKNGKLITFLDTPGHEAFTAMRARGAKVTDIAILVVSADEGVKPQTLEALNHVRDARVPIIVALTKIDKPNINIDRVKSQLAEHDLLPEDWGGKTIYVPVSAVTGEGIDTLLEMILLTAEMAQLKANPSRPAIATVIEANLNPSLGPVATVLINTGTLHMMDNVIVGEAYGRIKLMRDAKGKKLKELLPSDTAQIAGLSKAPQSGDILQVVTNEKEARTKAQSIEQIQKAKLAVSGLTMEELIQRIKDGRLKMLKLVIKADTQGSLEAILDSLKKIKNDTVGFKVIHSGVGNVNESDVHMCLASGGVVLAFHTEVPTHTERLADKEHVQILKYTIIYKLIDEVKDLLAGMLEPEIVDVELGVLEIRGIFHTKKKEMIIGGKVLSGVVQNKSKVKVMRGGNQVGEGTILSLHKVDQVIDEMKAGGECGMKFEGNVTIEIGDEFVVWKKETRMRSLASSL